MKKIITLLFILCCSLHLQAQFAEHIMVFTDKDCYVAGERLHVSVAVTDGDRNPLDLSKVAYVELSDTRGLQAQTMVQLTDGRGWADIALPATLHNGFYQLTAYTRNLLPQGEKAFWRSLIGVVNTQQLQAGDNVTFHQPDAAPAMRRQYQAGQVANLSLPQDSGYVIRTLSVVRNPLRVSLFEAPDPTDKQYATAADCLPELEGHIVRAITADGAVATQSRLAGVGKGFAVFDGLSSDGGRQWQYFTNGLTGSLPLVVNAYDANNRPIAMQVQSPYAEVLPKALPMMDVYADEAALRQRTLSAKAEAAFAQALAADTIEYTATLLSREPDRLYKVDEWTGFSSIREAMLEYVQDVRRRTIEGRTYLCSRNAETREYSRLPALVLLDGMPVNDIDEILAYDARLLEYIQIYSGSYVFGCTQCHGVVSFITHKGLLSNFQPDKGSRLMRYDFPQQRPAFTLPSSSSTSSSSTVCWNPCVESAAATFTVPSQPGIYQITLSGIDARGELFRSVSEMEVK